MASLLLQGMFKAMGMTDIDRRTCSRKVPMEVLVLGCSRTGTTSIRAALKQLGYEDTYHAGCVYKENPRDAEMWVDAYRAKYHGEGKKFGKEEFDQLLGHCMAVTDVPCLHFKEDLCTAYPTAKIVLTMRDSPEAWLKSVRTTLIPFAQQSVGASLFDDAKALFTPRLPFQRMNDEMVSNDGLSSLRSFENTSADDYLKHNDEVRKLAEANGMELLEFNVKQGWRPLCEFLHKGVPRDERGEEMPFPRLNDSKSFRKAQKGIFGVLNVLAGVNVVLTIAGVWAAWRAALWVYER